MRFELIPAIDLKGGKCVRLQEGVASRATEYSDNPVETALRWQEEGACRLHLVDLDGAFSGGSTHLATARAIFRAVRIPVQFGGGVRTLEQVKQLLDAGAARVILGTIAAEQPDVVAQAVERFHEAMVVGIDARHGKVALRGWVDQSATSALELALGMKARGIERIIYTDIARDGLLRGVNLEETEALARESGLRVIASGGVADTSDVRALWERRSAGIEGVILGRALYERKVDFGALQTQVARW